jgi:hypothetical protein
MPFFDQASLYRFLAALGVPTSGAIPDLLGSGGYLIASPGASPVTGGSAPASDFQLVGRAGSAGSNPTAPVIASPPVASPPAPASAAPSLLSPGVAQAGTGTPVQVVQIPALLRAAGFGG